MLLVNEVLHGRYRVIRQLGRGGMGAVYEAHDNVFDTTIALKEIMIDMAKIPSKEQQESIKHAFEREAKLLAKIKHETVPHVRDYFSEDNRQFLVMELVEGKELGELMDERKSPFPLEDVLRWLEQLLDGLDYLHTQNPPIYHRDIKPQNLKLTDRGKIKLLDFGIAKGGGTNEPTDASTVGNQTFVAATLNYSPIEQTFRVLDPIFREVLSQRFSQQVDVVMTQNADARSDIYALGATVYHLLTGRLPLDSLKRTTEIWAGKPDPLIHPSNLNDRIPAEISALLLKSMEIDRNNRFTSAIDMQQALNQATNAIRNREKNRSKNWQNELPDTGWQSGGNEQSQAPTLETKQKDLPTMQIPLDQLRQSMQSTSEQTIQGNPQNYAQPPINNPFNTGGNNQVPPPIGSPFDTGGNTPFQTSGGQHQQPTEHYNFAGNSTGGSGSISNPINTGGQSFPSNTGGQSFPPPINTGGQGIQANQNFMPQTAVQPKKGGRMFLWLIPIFILLFLVVGGGAVGVWVWQSQNEVEPTPTPKPSVSPAPSVSPSVSPSVNGGDTPKPTPTAEETPTDTPNVEQTPRPTVAPKTPVQQKTPVQKKTPPPKKKVTVDDIINDAD